MATERILPPDESYYYADSQPTTRLDGPSAPLDAYLPSRPVPFILALIIALSAPLYIGWAAYRVGYAAGYAVGVLQPWIDARGWVALLFIAIGAPILIIAAQSRKTYTYSDL